jgi:hypothetical protein
VGGKAFGEGASDRLSSDEYYDLRFKLFNRLELFKGKWDRTPLIVKSYFTKDSFGDMDILYSDDPQMMRSFMSYAFGGHVPTIQNGNATSFLVKSYEHVPTIQNGSITSFLVESHGKSFQIDCINVPKEEFNFAYRYFCWNDCGNLIGRVAHRVGLRFAHNGLYHIQRAKDNNSLILGKHLLTRDFDKALQYLDLDCNKHQRGFYNPQDIFRFIVKSKYFDFSSVDLNKRNSVSRTRDRKRKIYRQFLEWLAENELDKYNTTLPEKGSFLPQHFERFPKFKESYLLCEQIHEKNNKFKDFFNGEIVSSITKLQGKELGGFMSRFRDEYTMDDILSWTEDQRDLRIALFNG